MSDFNFTHDKENYQIRVKTPFNREFVTKARNLRGSWDKKTEEWVFDDSIEDYVKAALMEIYGTTGEEPVETCSLLIKKFRAVGDRAAVELFGRTIAKAWGRDSGAKLGDNIIWISGTYQSGGSVKNWNTRIENGHFEIQNFPVARTRFDDVQEAIAEGWCEIKMPKKKRRREDIEAEIKKQEDILAQLKTELENL
ncbi:hypothetical protein SAMN05443429_1129 [Cruoricaptor ignavus]|uniref:Uncharacterized protein n=1 Tax=Cruoricaptor ignavus TaxID=1118202 RepID=A0A1M6HC84_9FLAO|nr:hypothetical protein [Cruoricaptor ignavus]SHJ19764.1 hypothetical protein SAMN05443429_1129 [Cruoricaptor ignavus]